MQRYKNEKETNSFVQRIYNYKENKNCSINYYQ